MSVNTPAKCQYAKHELKTPNLNGETKSGKRQYPPSRSSYYPCQHHFPVFHSALPLLGTKKHVLRTTTTKKKPLELAEAFMESPMLYIYCLKKNKIHFLEVKYRLLETNQIENHLAIFQNENLTSPIISLPSELNLGPHTPTAPSTVKQKHYETSVGHIFLKPQIIYIFQMKTFVKH